MHKFRYVALKLGDLEENTQHIRSLFQKFWWNATPIFCLSGGLVYKWVSERLLWLICGRTSGCRTTRMLPFPNSGYMNRNGLLDDEWMTTLSVIASLVSYHQHSSKGFGCQIFKLICLPNDEVKLLLKQLMAPQLDYISHVWGFSC